MEINLNYTMSQFTNKLKEYHPVIVQGRIQDLIRGGAPDRDRPKTAILGPQFWCWGLIFGGQGGARAPGAPPLDPPLLYTQPYSTTTPIFPLSLTEKVIIHFHTEPILQLQPCKAVKTLGQLSLKFTLKIQ